MGHASDRKKSPKALPAAARAPAVRATGPILSHGSLARRPAPSFHGTPAPAHPSNCLARAAPSSPALCPVKRGPGQPRARRPAKLQAPFRPCPRLATYHPPRLNRGALPQGARAPLPCPALSRRPGIPPAQAPCHTRGRLHRTPLSRAMAAPATLSFGPGAALQPASPITPSSSSMEIPPPRPSPACNLRPLAPCAPTRPPSRPPPPATDASPPHQLLSGVRPTPAAPSRPTRAKPSHQHPPRTRRRPWPPR
ncbi:MAG: hypothetical protein J3K34DRAFT_409902 [Monoraphidium minutum]|nr:MAG: hypothetical protein J3K34DRAFT_409902 [Monoraphidium minutum]